MTSDLSSELILVKSKMFISVFQRKKKRNEGRHRIKSPTPDDD